MGLGHARSSLGLHQKVQGVEMPEKGLEEGWTRSRAARSLGGKPWLLRRTQGARALLGRQWRAHQGF